jgi:hypothetical protein
MTAKSHRKSRFVMKYYSISIFNFHYGTLMTKLSLRAHDVDSHHRIAGVIDPHDVTSWMKRCYTNWPFYCSTFFKMAVIKFQYLANMHLIFRQFHVAIVVTTSEFRASNMSLLQTAVNCKGGGLVTSSGKTSLPNFMECFGLV